MLPIYFDFRRLSRIIFNLLNISELEIAFNISSYDMSYWEYINFYPVNLYYSTLWMMVWIEGIIDSII